MTTLYLLTTYLYTLRYAIPIANITCPTHIKGNTIDYVITNGKTNIISNTSS